MIQQSRSTFVIIDPSEIVQALVGLKDVRVLAYERHGPDVSLVIEQTLDEVRCPRCAGPARLKDRPVVTYIDLPVFGSPMRLTWRKHRMRCVDPACAMKSWVLRDHRIAAKSCLLTTRAAKWATEQVGTGRSVKEVAHELSCEWHTVNDAVLIYGQALLVADTKRLTKTTAIGLDETSFVRLAEQRTGYATTVCDVAHHQVIDILPSRHFLDVAQWMADQGLDWRRRIAYGALDMSPTYAAVYSAMLPGAAQVVDPFHAVALANRALDAIRRRVQIEQLGHRGRKDDPLYRARRLLLRGEERLSAEAAERLASLLELGDPSAEVAIAYRVKERLRDFYRESDPDVAEAILADLREHCLRRTMPPEIRRLGKTIRTWFAKLCNFHLARVSNGPTESLNNLIKRIKRIGFGFRNFENYRIRALLYAGKPNWRVLGSIVVQ